MSKLLNFLKKTFVFFKGPFSPNGIFFLLIWLLISVYQVDTYFITKEYAYAVCLLMALFICAYIITFFIEKTGLFGKILKIPFYAILVIFNLIYIYSTICLGSFRVSNVWTIILNTNLGEAREFVAGNITLMQSIFIVLGVFLFISLYYVSVKVKVTKNSIAYIGLSILIVSLVTTFYYRKVWHDVLGKRVSTPDMVMSKNLNNYLTNPQISVQENGVPKVILIIGESFAKKQSSLYGYRLKTNPLLQKMVDDSLLYVFDKVTSPGVFTAEVFKYILNTKERKSLEKWYESTSLIEVFNIAGFYTYWISNQEKNGFVDNISSNYSQLCKNEHFNERDVTLYDDFMLKNIVNVDNKMLVIYHLYGQHPIFSKRFPPSFKQFEESMYDAYNENQKKTLADYDNATIYNDFIVSSIMKSYDNEDAVVFYFSDHGMDIYDSSPDFAGHAKWGIKESFDAGLQIPFMIYTSPIAKQKHPHLAKRIEESLHNQFNTEFLIYTVMDIAGLSFGDERVKKYSLLNE